MSQYNDPNFTVIREKHITGTLSVATAANSAFAGSTLRTFAKAVVVGVSWRVQSGGSAAGSNSFKICKLSAGGSFSLKQGNTLLVSAGASAAGDVVEVSLTTPFTLESLGVGAVLVGNAASLDKIPVLSDICWRFRFLPQTGDVFDKAPG